MSEKRNVIKATVVVTAFALAGKVLGFVREMIIADKFGTTFRSDAYFIGLAGPDFIGNIIFGTVLVAGFIPVYASYIHNNDEAQAKKLLNNTGSILLVLILLVVLAGIPLAPRLVGLIAPEMHGSSLVLAVQVTRIVFPAMLFAGFANLYGTLLNMNKHFATPSMGQFIQNIFIVVGAVFFGHDADAFGLHVQSDDLAHELVAGLLEGTDVSHDVSPWLFEPATTAASMAISRPKAIDAAPACGPKRSGGRRRTTLLFREEWAHRGPRGGCSAGWGAQGKKVAPSAVAAQAIEAQPVFGQIKP